MKIKYIVEREKQVGESEPSVLERMKRESRPLVARKWSYDFFHPPSFVLWVALISSFLLSSSARALGLPPPPPTFSVLDKIQRDFLALTRRSTTRHILLPKSRQGYEAALALKQKIRNRASFSTKDVGTDKKGMYVVDSFALAAEKFSLDNETAGRGGLLGTLVPQGYCICPELDEACFTAPLGEVSGPIESDFGHHLVLVCERTNCPKLDGGMTRVIRGDDGSGRGYILAPPEGGKRSVSDEVAEFSLGQIGFWMGAFLAGGVVAELAAKAAGVLDSLPWEDQIPFE